MKDLRKVFVVLMVLLSVQYVGAHDEVLEGEFTYIDGIRISHDLLANDEAVQARFGEAGNIEVFSVRPLVFGSEFDWYRLKVRLLVSPDSDSTDKALHECGINVESIAGYHAESFSMLGNCKQVYWPSNNVND